MTGLRGSGLGYPDGFAIDRAHDTFPAREGFFQADFNGGDKVVTVALEVGVFFL